MKYFNPAFIFFLLLNCDHATKEKKNEWCFSIRKPLECYFLIMTYFSLLSDPKSYLSLWDQLQFYPWTWFIYTNIKFKNIFVAIVCVEITFLDTQPAWDTSCSKPSGSKGHLCILAQCGTQGEFKGLSLKPWTRIKPAKVHSGLRDSCCTEPFPAEIV